jgi:hypothetical protein
MPVFRSVVSVLVRFGEEFLYELKAGPAGGRLRRPSSRRQRLNRHRGAGLTLHDRGAKAVTTAWELCGSSDRPDQTSLQEAKQANYGDCTIPRLPAKE